MGTTLKILKIKIIMDAAAASIDDLKVSKIIPTMLSLHATKILTAGEGGLIIIDNDDYIDTFKQKINFGLGSHRKYTYKAQTQN